MARAVAVVRDGARTGYGAQPIGFPTGRRTGRDRPQPGATGPTAFGAAAAQAPTGMVHGTSPRRDPAAAYPVQTGYAAPAYAPPPRPAVLPPGPRVVRPAPVNRRTGIAALIADPGAGDRRDCRCDPAHPHGEPGQPAGRFDDRLVRTGPHSLGPGNLLGRWRGVSVADLTVRVFCVHIWSPAERVQVGQVALRWDNGVR